MILEKSKMNKVYLTDKQSEKLTLTLSPGELKKTNPKPSY
jgi:hypothetical protein